MLASQLGTDLTIGLSETDFKERESKYGSNYKPPPKRTPFYIFLLRALQDFILKVLLVCATISTTVELVFAEPDERSHGNIDIITLL